MRHAVPLTVTRFKVVELPGTGTGTAFLSYPQDCLLGEERERDD